MKCALMFDLDGTLVNSDYDLATAANESRKIFGLEPLSLTEVVTHVGYGLRYLIEHCIPAEFHDRIDEAREAFFKYYGVHLLDQTKPLPGADELLRTLGQPSALVTNKPGVFTNSILEGFGWKPFFGYVCAGDTLSHLGAEGRKPFPAPLLASMKALGVEHAVMVGDTEADRNAAKAAGVSFWCVPWGRAAEDVRLHPAADREELVLSSLEEARQRIYSLSVK